MGSRAVPVLVISALALSLATAFAQAPAGRQDGAVEAYLALTSQTSLGASGRDRAMKVLRDAYERMLSSAPGSTSPRVLVPDLAPGTLARTPVAGDDATRAHLARAREAETEGRLADARREYTAAVAGTEAGRHLLYVGIGRLAQVEGDLDAAIEAFGEAARLNPNDPLIHRERAAAYAAADRVDSAFAELVAALLLAPDDAEVLAAIGQLYLDVDRAADAIPALRRALLVKAGRYQTHYALAMALSRVGKTDEAAREFEQFERTSKQALENRRRQVSGEAPQ